MLRNVSAAYRLFTLVSSIRIFVMTSTRPQSPPSVCEYNPPLTNLCVQVAHINSLGLSLRSGQSTSYSADSIASNCDNRTYRSTGRIRVGISKSKSIESKKQRGHGSDIKAMGRVVNTFNINRILVRHLPFLDQLQALRYRRLAQATDQSDCWASLPSFLSTISMQMMPQRRQR